LKEETGSDVYYPGSRRELGLASPQVSHSDSTVGPTTSADCSQKCAQSLQNPTRNLHSPTSSYIRKPDDLISLLDAQIAAISTQITQTTDPTRLQELMKAERLVRRYRKNELSSRRLRLRHLRDRHRHSPRKQKFQADPNANQIDLVELLAFLRQLADVISKLGPDKPTPDTLRQVTPPQAMKSPLFDNRVLPIDPTKRQATRNC
jgi:hypothetical protein